MYPSNTAVWNLHLVTQQPREGQSDFIDYSFGVSEVIEGTVIR